MAKGNLSSYYMLLFWRIRLDGKSKDTPGFDVTANRKSLACLFHMVGKKWLRMWKNNKATEPARTNRRIKSTSMASTGRKAKLREKTKVRRAKVPRRSFCCYQVPDVCGWNPRVETCSYDNVACYCGVSLRLFSARSCLLFLHLL